MNAAGQSNEPSRRGAPADTIVTHNGGGRGKVVDPRALACALDPYGRTGGAVAPKFDPDAAQDGDR